MKSPGLLLSQERLDGYYENVDALIRPWNGKYQAACDRYPFLRYLPQDQVIEIVVMSPKVIHLLTSLVNHREISWRTKGKIGGVLAYFVSPIDVIPEAFVGPVGYVDDVTLAIGTVDKVLSGRNTREKNVINDVWQGSMRELDQLRDLVKVLRLWDRLFRHNSK